VLRKLSVQKWLDFEQVARGRYVGQSFVTLYGEGAWYGVHVITKNDAGGNEYRKTQLQKGDKTSTGKEILPKPVVQLISRYQDKNLGIKPPHMSLPFSSEGEDCEGTIPPPFL
jgi:hypothetical protein